LKIQPEQKTLKIMRKKSYRIINCMLLISSIIPVTNSCAVWGDLTRIFSDESNTDANHDTLTNNEVIQGLKEALAKGTKSSVEKLGRKNGFFHNPKVKIQVPESLEKVDNILRKLKQDKFADEFILTMNRAAEQAVPEAAQIFTDVILNMKFDDARKILEGPDDSATGYFINTSHKKLAEKMLPVVKKSSTASGVTAKYKKMVGKLGPASKLIDKDSLDLDQYITDKTLEGLFSILVEEEHRIRTDPAARTSQILKRVFGS
jgi:hypothetical protein